MIPQCAPMIPTQMPEPFHRDVWVYEEKVDGWRSSHTRTAARVRLVSRRGVDHARSPERDRSREHRYPGERSDCDEDGYDQSTDDPSHCYTPGHSA